MAATRGEPEPVKTREERASEALTSAIAGQGIVRRVILWVVLTCSLIAGTYWSPALIPGMVAAALLMATDTGLA